MSTLFMSFIFYIDIKGKHELGRTDIIMFCHEYDGSINDIMDIICHGFCVSSALSITV